MCSDPEKVMVIIKVRLNLEHMRVLYCNDVCVTQFSLTKHILHACGWGLNHVGVAFIFLTLENFLEISSSLNPNVRIYIATYQN